MASTGKNLLIRTTDSADRTERITKRKKPSTELSNICIVPEELLVDIFSNLHHSSASTVRTFYSLCQVSRQFNRIATPLLYRTVNHCVARSPTLSLSHKLTQNPELAAEVRTLRAYVSTRKSYTFEVQDTTDHLVDCIHSLNPKGFKRNKDRWDPRRQCWSQVFGIELAVILAQTSELEHFIIEGRPLKKAKSLESVTFSPPWLSALVQNATHPHRGFSHSFKHLRRLTITAHVLAHQPTINRLLQLPSLYQFDLIGANYESFHEASILLERSMSPVRVLSLYQCRLEGGTVARMILACKELTSFTYTDAVKHRHPQGDFYSHLERALCHHRHSLRNLLIGDFFDHGYPINNFRDMFTDLGRFDSLQTLAIPLRTIFSASGGYARSFPPNIKSLSLEVFVPVLQDPLMKTFAVVCRHSCPSLIGVHICTIQPRDPPEFNLAAHSALCETTAEIFERNGLYFSSQLIERTTSHTRQAHYSVHETLDVPVTGPTMSYAQAQLGGARHVFEDDLRPKLPYSVLPNISSTTSRKRGESSEEHSDDLAGVFSDGISASFF